MISRLPILAAAFLSTVIAANGRAEDLESTPVANDFGRTISLLAPRTAIQASEIAVVINDSDAQSVDVGNYYSLKHNIPAANVIHVAFPAGMDAISETDFTALKNRVDTQLSADIQAYAITWSRPWKVGAGMGITSAFALGYNSKYVAPSVCNTTAAVPYYNSATTRPYGSYGIRPAMVVGGTNAQNARAVIDRGVLAQQNLPTGDGYFVRTSDAARSKRYSDFQSTVMSWNRPNALRMNYIDNSTGTGMDYIQYVPNVLFYLTGLPTVPAIATNQYVPGAAADHVTSYGGALFGGGQMSILRWLEAGATASYGTVVEPCSYTQKFPVASILVRNYFGGGTVLESYWKSVNQPGEGIFVGDPLARPFGTRATYTNGILEITTTILQPAKAYTLMGADSAAGPFYPLQSNITVAAPAYRTITETAGPYAFYKLVEATDTTAPTVSIASPTQGTVVQGVVGVTANAADNSGSVSSVAFSVDGTIQATDSTAPFTFDWDTKKFSNGTHTLTASGRDATGNVGTNSAAVMVGNPLDTTAPTIAITSPAAGSVLKKGKPTAVQVAARDNVAVVRVELYVNGVLSGKSTSSPFTISVSANALNAGTNSLMSKAYDASNNVGSSASIQVIK